MDVGESLKDWRALESYTLVEEKSETIVAVLHYFAAGVCRDCLVRNADCGLTKF